LVICDGCCSAQTSLDSEADSQTANTLLPGCAAFANAFGPKVAYMGWSWKEQPTCQSWTSEFVGDLQGKGVTVQTAYQKFLNNHLSNASTKEMKIYGNTGVIVDKNSNP
jgi:hypothetical protein